MRFLKRYGLWAALLLVAVTVLWMVQSEETVYPSEQLLAAAEGLDEITISAELNVQKQSLSVTQTMTLINRTGQKQDAAVLRTWANAFQSMDASPCTAEDALFDRYYPAGFSSGGLTMAQTQVNGEGVLYRYLDEARTILKVPVPGGWQQDAAVELKLTYTIQVPQMTNRFGVWEDAFALGNAFAIPAVWEDGAFRMDAYASVGDPFVSDCANYSVSITVPKGYVCAGSASSGVKTAEGKSVYTFRALAVRDFALVISKCFETAQTTQNGVLITAYADSVSHAKEMLKYGKKALAAYAEAFGSYPYPSYSLAQIDFSHGGAEYPALSMISTELVEKGKRELEYAVAHETAHQWWYAVVGSDSWHQPWQDEALCEFSLLAYAEKYYGVAERNDLEQSRMESALRVTVPQGVTPGAPLDYFASMSQYRLVVYDRGAACLCALDRTVPLDGFLRDYYQNYAFKRATRADFEQQLFASTGEDLTPLMRDYLDTAILN